MKLARPVVTLVLMSFALAWAVFFDGGVLLPFWNITLLAVGLLSLCYWLFTKRSQRAAPLPRWHLWALVSLPLYLGFQLLPLPISWLHLFSPARWGMTHSLAPIVAGIHTAPIDVNPPQAAAGLCAMLCYLATFFLMREIGWLFADRPWIPLLPLIAIGAVEASIGLFQVFALASDAPQATGTYANRNHFAGLLEMILPIATLHGLAVLRRSHSRHNSSVKAAMGACGFWTAAALMLGAIAYSLSRMGFVVALSTLFVVAAIVIVPRLPSFTARILFVAFLPIGALLVLLIFPPQQLIARFADLSAAHGVTSIDRLFFAKETLDLIKEFPLFGCGIGGFESTFLKHQAVANFYRVEFAHNDYLQFVAELGLFGAAILACAVFGVLLQISKGMRRLQDEERHLLLIACAGAFIAIMLHSLVDFNLQIHANAMTLAWIGGVGSINGLD